MWLTFLVPLFLTQLVFGDIDFYARKNAESGYITVLSSSTESCLSDLTFLSGLLQMNLPDMTFFQAKHNLIFNDFAEDKISRVEPALKAAGFGAFKDKNTRCGSYLEKEELVKLFESLKSNNATKDVSEIFEVSVKVKNSEIQFIDFNPTVKLMKSTPMRINRTFRPNGMQFSLVTTVEGTSDLIYPGERIILIDVYSNKFFGDYDEIRYSESKSNSFLPFLADIEKPNLFSPPLVVVTELIKDAKLDLRLHFRYQTPCCPSVNPEARFCEVCLPTEGQYRYASFPTPLIFHVAADDTVTPLGALKSELLDLVPVPVLMLEEFPNIETKMLLFSFGAVFSIGVAIAIRMLSGSIVKIPREDKNIIKIS
eukprot:GHVP01031418.1.p1 GENE.GHVP01031418.1~~GHVP01031418.1.p1  ORF type:complete len:368 (+),score=79.25 GHVP01031418.1:724-1827(+)